MTYGRLYLLLLAEYAARVVQCDANAVSCSALTEAAGLSAKLSFPSSRELSAAYLKSINILFQQLHCVSVRILQQLWIFPCMKQTHFYKIIRKFPWQASHNK